MSGRALIAIGCDAYDHIGVLSGADADARNVFEMLKRPEVGDYDSAQAVWASRPIEAGTPLNPPTPVFKKLDDSIVEEELARLEETAQ